MIGGKPRGDRWIVRYRRYSSDEWLEESFTSCAAAVLFKDNYLYDRGPEAQCVIQHFVPADKATMEVKQ